MKRTYILESIICQSFVKSLFYVSIISDLQISVSDPITKEGPETLEDLNEFLSHKRE